MWPVLLRIPVRGHLPESMGGWPLFGIGALLALWVLWSIIKTSVEIRARGWSE